MAGQDIFKPESIAMDGCPEYNGANVPIATYRSLT
jgi:hypothetical protein